MEKMNKSKSALSNLISAMIEQNIQKTKFIEFFSPDGIGLTDNKMST